MTHFMSFIIIFLAVIVTVAVCLSVLPCFYSHDIAKYKQDNRIWLITVSFLRFNFSLYFIVVVSMSVLFKSFTFNTLFYYNIFSCLFLYFHNFLFYFRNFDISQYSNKHLRKAKVLNKLAKYLDLDGNFRVFVLICSGFRQTPKISQLLAKSHSIMCFIELYKK